MMVWFRLYRFYLLIYLFCFSDDGALGFPCQTVKAGRVHGGCWRSGAEGRVREGSAMSEGGSASGGRKGTNQTALRWNINRFLLPSGLFCLECGAPGM